MRIAVLVDRFPQLTETFVSNEVAELARAGHAVRVEAGAPPLQAAPEAPAVPFANRADDTRADRLAALARIIGRHPVRCARDLVGRRRWRAEEQVPPLRWLAPAVVRVRRHRAQHLHAHFATGAALDALRIGAILDLPYSLTTHGHDLFKTPRNLCLKHARSAFALSVCDYSVDYVRSICPGAEVHRQVMGVDADRFCRTQPQPGGRTVVAVARLTEKKGLRYLVEAAALLRDRGAALDRVLIAGGGPLREELQALVAEHRLEETVELLGPINPRDVCELLEHADVVAAPCVIASDGDRDTMPVVVKEALSMEVPVVASDAVGLPEVVRPQWGRLTAPGDPLALADALAEVLALPLDERAAMGRSGRAFVQEHCSIRRETQRLADLIRSSR